MIDVERNRMDALGAWLAERRWYGEKARSLTGASTVFRATERLGVREVAVEVVRLAYADGGNAQYLLVRDSGDRDGDGVDSEPVRAWLLEGFAGDRSLPGEEGGTLTWQSLPGIDDAWHGSADRSRVLRGEQSNSSIVYGDRAILKLFRKLQEGVNPEVEVGMFLTREAEFRAVPRLLGTITLESAGSAITVGAVQEYIPSVGDAWSWVLSRIGDRDGRTATIDAARLLGTRTAEMHVAFASGMSESFVPELASDTYAEAVRLEALDELRDTVDQLTPRGVVDAGVLGVALQGVMDAFAGLRGTMITRIHGDYHLGQVLRTNAGDLAILDFEGEPARSLAERRAKASPLRDVAGMLRSFDYAAETAGRASGSDLEQFAAWREAARAAFLDGYDTTARQNTMLMRGWDADARIRALAAFEVHKALYEVRYEVGNRPDLLDIPLNALRRIAAARIE